MRLWNSTNKGRVLLNEYDFAQQHRQSMLVFLATILIQQSCKVKGMSNWTSMQVWFQSKTFRKAEKTCKISIWQDCNLPLFLFTILFFKWARVTSLYPSFSADTNCLQITSLYKKVTLCQLIGHPCQRIIALPYHEMHKKNINYHCVFSCYESLNRQLPNHMCKEFIILNEHVKCTWYRKFIFCQT